MVVVFCAKDSEEDEKIDQKITPIIKVVTVYFIVIVSIWISQQKLITISKEIQYLFEIKKIKINTIAIPTEDYFLDSITI